MSAIKRSKELWAWARGAHVFFWLLLVAVVPAIAAGALTDEHDAAWALHSEWVYRAEVALAVFLAAYVLALALCLAYQGRSIGRLGVPGGPELEGKDPSGLDKAAEGAEAFQAETRKNFDDHSAAIAALDERLAALEDQ